MSERKKDSTADQNRRLSVHRYTREEYLRIYHILEQFIALTAESLNTKEVRDLYEESQEDFASSTARPESPLFHWMKWKREKDRKNQALFQRFLKLPVEAGTDCERYMGICRQSWELLLYAMKARIFCTRRKDEFLISRAERKLGKTVRNYCQRKNGNIVTAHR